MPSILTRPSGGGGAGGGSVSVGLSDTTPKLGQSVTITATATGITPTSYTFYLPQQDGSFETVTQAGNTYAWAVSKYGNFTVSVTATDGVNSGVASAGGTTSGDVNADAFIAAHNTATGGTMDSTMEANTLGFFLRLKGVNTTYNENVFAELLAANAELYPMIPDDVSGASISGYSINAIDPTNNATMVGFVAGDATVDGLTGGGGKYMIMNNAPSDYGQDDISIHSYVRTYSNFDTVVGATDGTNTGGAPGATACILGMTSSNRTNAVLNGLTLAQGFNNYETGFVSVLRNNSEAGFQKKEGIITSTNFETSIAPSSQPFYGMAGNANGTADRNYAGSISCISNAPYLEECALATLAEAVEWLQTQIGRNV